MRKRLLIGVWLLVPVVLLAVHYGPGQRGIARDRAAEKLALAQAAEKTEAWTDAMQHYADALAALPSTDAKQRYKIRLAAARARMYSGELPEAKADLEGLLADAQKSGADASLVREIRA